MSIKQYKLTIDRYTDEGKTPKSNWKNLISALVLVGYEVYGDNKQITFTLGCTDIIEEVKESELKK